MNLIEQTKEVANWRIRVVELQATAKKLEAEFRQQYTELYANLDTAKVALEITESTLRASIVAQFNETGDKHPAVGLGIRENVELVYDEKAALAWAKEHSICLALDRKAFEKVAKATPDALPFVVQQCPRQL